MPSGPKKRRAARKKNDSDSTISIHTHHEDKVVVAAEMSTLEAPLMDTLLSSIEKGNEDVQVSESLGTTDKESVIDQMIEESSLNDLNSKKIQGNKLVAEDVETMYSKEVIEHPLLDLHDPSLLKELNLVQAGFASENPQEMVKLIKSDSKDHGGSLNEKLESGVNDPPASVINSVQVSSIAHSKDVGQVKKLVEQLLRISTEISNNAEYQLSFSKQLSLNLSQLLEEASLHEDDHL